MLPDSNMSFRTEKPHLAGIYQKFSERTRPSPRPARLWNVAGVRPDLLPGSAGLPAV